MPPAARQTRKSVSGRIMPTCCVSSTFGRGNPALNLEIPAMATGQPRQHLCPTACPSPELDFRLVVYPQLGNEDSCSMPTQQHPRASRAGLKLRGTTNDALVERRDRQTWPGGVREGPDYGTNRFRSGRKRHAWLTPPPRRARQLASNAKRSQNSAASVPMSSTAGSAAQAARPDPRFRTEANGTDLRGTGHRQRPSPPAARNLLATISGSSSAPRCPRQAGLALISAGSD